MIILSAPTLEHVQDELPYPTLRGIGCGVEEEGPVISH